MAEKARREAVRVEGPHGPFREDPQKEKVGDRKKSAESIPGTTAPPSFVQELSGAILEEEKQDESFEQMLAQVEEEGKQLVAHPDEKHLRTYRESIKKFLNAMVKKAFKIKIVEGRGPNPKLYVVIEKIEGKLEELAVNVLAQQKQPLRILAQVEELRGLLLDLKS